MMTQPVMPPEIQSAPTPKLGIIAGSGDLPARLIASCLDQGREFFVLGLEGAAEESMLAHTPHAWVRLGAIGEAIDHLKQANVRELVLAGRIARPSISSLRPDALGAKLLARLGVAFFSGDDKLLSGLIRFLEEQGFRIVGADDLLQECLTPEGLIGSTLPDKRSQEDIATGAKVARALGALDVGQAVVVQHGVVLGVEAIEGTDELIARCGQLKQDGSGGVLVKVKKPSQERRVDLPTIGVATVENIHCAGLAGIAVEAGHSLIIDRKDVARKADALGVFIVGFTLDNEK